MMAWGRIVAHPRPSFDHGEMLELARRTCLLSVVALCVLSTSAAAAQGSPNYLEDSDDDGLAPELPYDGLGPSYRDLLVAGYLFGIPAATMTAGVGLLLPVGVHYKHGNDAGGNRALWGILGGLALGATVGGLLDQPEGGFAFTAGMAYGMLGGYFTWGTIDIAFFADPPASAVMARTADSGRQSW